MLFEHEEPEGPCGLKPKERPKEAAGGLFCPALRLLCVRPRRPLEFLSVLGKSRLAFLVVAVELRFGVVCDAHEAFLGLSREPSDFLFEVRLSPRDYFPRNLFCFCFACVPEITPEPCPSSWEPSFYCPHPSVNCCFVFFERGMFSLVVPSDRLLGGSYALCT